MYNILVVDDEKTIRDGLTRMIASLDGEKYAVRDAEDGEKALEIVQQSMPDIIITDINMPKMNGIEFIENSKMIHPNVKIVIISGYNEFEFAQKAMKLGVSDYLLKPIERDNLIEVLENICNEIDTMNQLLYDVEKLKRIVKESLPAARERFLNRLATGGSHNDEYLERAAYLNMEIRGKLYTIAMFKIKNSTGDPGSDFSNEEMLTGFFNTTCNDLFDHFIKAYPFYYENDRLAIFLCSADDSRQKMFISVNQSLNRAIAFIQREFGLELCVSIGRLYERLDDLPVCCREAEDSLHYNLFKTKNTIINVEDIHFEHCQFGRPAELENKLLVHIRLGENEQALAAVDQLCIYYQTMENSNPHLVKILVLETAVLILRTVDELMGSECMDGSEGARFYKGILECNTLVELHTWLNQLVLNCLKKIDEKRQSKSLSVVQKAKELMNAFISEPELSIEYLSERLYISPNYLRQLFRQKEGKSFVEYLTALRMEKAMQLMNTTSLKIQEISEKVGFNDARYFTFCFKKYCQLTPSEYKEIMGGNK